MDWSLAKQRKRKGDPRGSKLSSCSPKQKGRKQERMAATLDQSIVAHEKWVAKMRSDCSPKQKGKKMGKNGSQSKIDWSQKITRNRKGGPRGHWSNGQLSPKQKGRRQERMATAWEWSLDPSKKGWLWCGPTTLPNKKGKDRKERLPLEYQLVAKKD